MSSAPASPPASGGRPRGATALGALDARSGHRHRRHLLGDALRAVSVFVSAAFDVAVLGDYAEVRDEERREEEAERTRRRAAGAGERAGAPAGPGRHRLLRSARAVG
ncbi:MAG TPA: hypothetical protein VE546_26910 [Streptomyces sp.]|uniref:hypothetical protein n=1 Tax=Streptomyces sp. TaxID=1931 RepID=UPI002D431C7B|nr:hypothetical protein [Streptomyces sp.]HZG07156.1 hypothetical protein [Streptomyces sp.]